MSVLDTLHICVMSLLDTSPKNQRDHNFLSCAHQGFDGCWNLELLIQNVLPVRGHGIGCAGDAKCLRMQSSQACVDAIYSMCGYPLGSCDRQRTGVGSRGAWKVGRQFFGTADCANQPSTPQPSKVRNVSWNLEYLCSVHLNNFGAEAVSR
jgi:hypothetical protein